MDLLIVMVYTHNAHPYLLKIIIYIFIIGWKFLDIF